MVGLEGVVVLGGGLFEGEYIDDGVPTPRPEVEVVLVVLVEAALKPCPPPELAVKEGRIFCLVEFH